MGGHLSLFSRGHKSTTQDKSAFETHLTREQEGQKTGETRSKLLVKLIRGMKAVIKLRTKFFPCIRKFSRQRRLCKTGSQNAEKVISRLLLLIL
jgi:hypothetical protein